MRNAIRPPAGTDWPPIRFKEPSHGLAAAVFVGTCVLVGAAVVPAILWAPWALLALEG